MRPFLAAVLALIPISTAAAEITPGGDPYMGCIATLSGVIGKDDGFALEELLYDLHQQRGGEGSLFGPDPGSASTLNGDRLCLDSPGGNFNTAIAMGGILRSWHMGTAVSRGARCESACAVVFLSGTRMDEDGLVRHPNRLLHAAGILGVHAPELVVRDRQYTPEHVSQAYALAIETIAELADRKSDWQISDTLLFRMLRTPPEDMARIETVFDAALWGIDLVGTVYPDRPTPLAAAHACTKVFARAVLSDPKFTGIPPLDDISLFGHPLDRTSTEDADTIRLQIFEEGTRSATCTFRMSRMPPQPGTAPNPAVAWAEVSFDGGPFEPISPAMMFDSRARLTELVRPEDDTVTGADVTTTTRPRNDHTYDASCGFWEDGTLSRRSPCKARFRRLVDENMNIRVRYDVVYGDGRTAAVLQPDTASREVTVNGQAGVRLDRERAPETGDATCFAQADADAVLCIAPL